MTTKKFANASRMPVRHTALAVAVAMGFGFSGHVLAQSTTGAVIGTAPVAAGETVKVVNKQTGLTRVVPVDSSGRYSATGLPVGQYTVSLQSNGQTVASQDNVTVSVAGPVTVPFAAAASSKNAQNLSSVTVTANSVPAIDVASTRQTSVITAQQLKNLPIARSAEAIALLAPGTASGASTLGTGPAGTPLISFGGDSVVENAYYINGFNTTDPVGNAGGIALPYFAIAEQQTITSGYGAEYGRSTGGVISQVGQRGGNDFHFGLYASFQPTWAQGSYDTIHYANPLSVTGGQEYGDVYRNRHQDSNWSNIYDFYISGPLIKNKLFFYFTAEAQHDNNSFASANTAGTYRSESTTDPKYYGKLDWNINDNNILELTGISSKVTQTSDNLYNYDTNTGTVGSFNSIANPLYSSKFNVGILKYTSYITDNLTLSVLYGKMKSTYYDQTLPFPGFDPTLPGMRGTSSGQNPTVPGYGNINTNADRIPYAGHKSTQGNFRLDLEWKLGDHDLKFGIDNVRSTDINDGTVSAGPGYYWVYGQATSLNPTTPLVGAVGGPNGYVASPVNYPNGQTGYYVDQVTYGSVASFTVEQRAQYIEDNWQVTPNLLLNLGIRNDQFTNYNSQMTPYIKETSPQWQPRIGFSWDIFGDSTAKLYGNVGRYYLALPSGLGTRMAGANAYTNVYYTYSSIDANGLPHGLTPIYQSRTPFSSDGEYGQPKDPLTVASTNLKPEYQDEYVLGFQKQLGDTGLVWTSQATYSRMTDIVDDTGAIYTPDGQALDVLVNPGRSQTIRYLAADGSGYRTMQWNPRTAPAVAPGLVGFPPAFRHYYSLEEALEHPWDGKWQGKIDYVFARSYGTTEGPTDSATNQISSASGAAGGHQSGSITEAWDFPEIMQYSNGDLPNSHSHTLKAYGAYAITPEWLVSGMYIIQSGAPVTCLGYYGPNQTDPISYGESYHWCGGHPAPPGTMGHTPWTHQINLGVSYIPEWAGKHLTLQMQIYNLLNEQNVTQYFAGYGSTAAGINPDPQYKLPAAVSDISPTAMEMPRYMQFTIKYDW